MTETVIDLIRHGEPEGGRVYRGHKIDDPLSEQGWQQMWDAIGDHCPWQRIISSPLKRCRAFSEAISDKHELPVTIEEQFREVGFGDWEGKTPEELKQDRAAEYQAFYIDPVHNRPTGAEPLRDFIARVSKAYDNIRSQYAGQRLLIVSHAGVMRAIIAHVLGAEPAGLYRINISNAGISRIRYDRHGAKLEYHNAFMSMMA